MFKKLMLTLFLFILLCTFFLGAGYLVLEHKIQQPINNNQQQLFQIKKGYTINALGQELVAKGWINETFWLKAFVKLNPQFSSLKAGTYNISASITLKDFLLVLTSGKEHSFYITFVEGTTLKEWLLQLEKNKHIKHTLVTETPTSVCKKLDINYSNCEGWFFPDTYAFTEQTSDLAILTRAHQQMNNHLLPLWQAREQAIPYKSAYEALIMASIVEKESAQLSEKSVIASVFVNRINKRMRLQTDPTVIYGLGERYKGNITKKHLREKTAYNTYRINGLPPTPIAMPGLAALKAVMAPDNTDYLYFVSRGDGHHVFSTNLADHNRAVSRYQLGIK